MTSTTFKTASLFRSQPRSGPHLTMRPRVICLSPSPPQSITSALSEISKTLSYSPSLSISDLGTSSNHLQVKNRDRPACQPTVPRVHKARKRTRERKKEKEGRARTKGEGDRYEGRKFEISGTVEVKRERCEGTRRTKPKSPPPNNPLIMSVAAENTAAKSGSEDIEDQFGDEEVQMSQVNEFVAIWFALGHLESDIPFPPIPISDASPKQVSNLARIMNTWMTKEPCPDILSAVTYGKVLGKQLLHACLNKGLTDKSLLNLIQDIADFYSEYCQDLEDEAGKTNSQREYEEEGKCVGDGGNGNGMGRLLKMVVEENDRVGVEVSGWGRMIWDANILFSLMHGATQVIGEAMGDAEREGI
ncbi:hypothetical protein DL98DRAFT_578883 [Cadophora sp. DSE1049]|nr:hypothetical protein DL98DRAFT_578883 [Cadophora sp. DSE1049]